MKDQILYAGRFSDHGSITGPECFGEQLLKELSPPQSAVIEYFFDGKKYSFWKKLFGFRKVISPVPHTQSGIIPIVLRLLFNPPRIVHLLSFEYINRIFLLFQSIFGYTIIYTAHGFISFEDGGKTAISEQKKLRNASLENELMHRAAVVCVSPILKMLLLEKFMYMDVPAVIPNGLASVPKQMRKRNIHKKIFTYSANPLRREHLLKFLAEQTMPAWMSFTVVEQKEYFHLYSKYPNVTVQEVMPPDEWKSFLRSQDVYVNFSAYETFSYVSLEAMAYGIIPIFTENTGIRSLLSLNDADIFQYPAGNYPELMNTLEQLMHISPERYEQLTNRYYHEAGNFSATAMSEQYTELYRQLLKN